MSHDQNKLGKEHFTELALLQDEKPVPHNAGGQHPRPAERTRQAVPGLD